MVTRVNVVALGLEASRVVTVSKEWLCGGRGAGVLVAEGGLQGMMIWQRVGLLDVGARTRHGCRTKYRASPGTRAAEALGLDG